METKLHKESVYLTTFLGEVETTLKLAPSVWKRVLDGEEIKRRGRIYLIGEKPIYGWWKFKNKELLVEPIGDYLYDIEVEFDDIYVDIH